MSSINKPSIINPFDITNYNRTIEEKQMFIIFAMAVAGKEAKGISFKVMDLIYNPIVKGFDKKLSLFENVKNLDKNIDPYEYFYVNTIGFNNDIIFNNDKSLKTPFEILKSFYDSQCMDQELKRVKLGKYALLNKGYTLLGKGELNLYGNEAMEPGSYEKIPGISFKSSRFFILHSYKNSEIAVLDTHILKFLRLIGVKECENVFQTPSSLKVYLEIEKKFLEILNGLRTNSLKVKIRNSILERLGDYLPEDLENLSASDFDFAIWKFSKTASSD